MLDFLQKKVSLNSNYVIKLSARGYIYMYCSQSRMCTTSSIILSIHTSKFRAALQDKNLLML